MIQRHSRSIDTDRRCCGKCRGKLIEIEVPGSEKKTSVNATVNGYMPKKRRQASAFSLFVQNNSAAVRARFTAENGGVVRQQDVMKGCSCLWKEKKL